MAPPRKTAARGRTRRRVRKNIAIGQAHIKTSFNNTIVALTDKDGNVIAWESTDSCPRTGTEHGLPRDDACVTGPGSARERAIRSLQAAGLEILCVKAATP